MKFGLLELEIFSALIFSGKSKNFTLITFSFFNRLSEPKQQTCLLVQSGDCAVYFVCLARDDVIFCMFSSVRRLVVIFCMLNSGNN